MSTKKCTSCSKYKDIECFRSVNYKRTNRDGSIYKNIYKKSVCKDCESIKRKEYLRKKYKEDPYYFIKRNRKNLEKNRDSILKKRREKTKQIKHETILLLGGKCIECGMNDEEVLQIDHIIPIIETGERRIYNDQRYKKVKESPEKFQILCSNCHIKKTNKENKKYWSERRDKPKRRKRKYE